MTDLDTLKRICITISFNSWVAAFCRILKPRNINLTEIAFGFASDIQLGSCYLRLSDGGLLITASAAQVYELEWKQGLCNHYSQVISM